MAKPGAAGRDFPRVNQVISHNVTTLNTRKVDLRHTLGCVVSSPKCWTPKFSSAANAGIIIIPPDNGQLVLKMNNFIYSIATMSRIDPRSGLPEFDAGRPTNSSSAGAFSATTAVHTTYIASCAKC